MQFEKIEKVYFDNMLYIIKLNHNIFIVCYCIIIKMIIKQSDFICYYITLLCCIVQYCIALYSVVLDHIVLYCVVLYCIMLCCTVLSCVVLYCVVLYCIVLLFIVLYCIVLYCVILFYYIIQLSEYKFHFQII